MTSIRQVGKEDLSFNLLDGWAYDLEPMVEEGLPFILPSGARQEKLSTVLAFDKFVNNVKAHAIMARAFAFYFKGNHFN